MYEGMKTILILVLFSLPAFAVEGLTIPNSYQVDGDGQVFRGREPKKLVNELPDIGITDVIIFKNEVKTEVTEEIEALKGLGIMHHHVPFRWKDFMSMEEACGQVVRALNILRKVKSRGGKVFFHCTAGEDRTGMLAGLYRMLEEGASQKKIFRSEMCARGYGDGNPNKPYNVTSAIQKELTPLFLSLAEKIENGDWSSGKLTKKSCKGIKIAPTELKCRP